MRLDVYLAEKGYYSSRNKAAEACERGEVTVDGKLRIKPSFSVDGTENIEICGEKYVSLGAYKLKRATEVFGLDYSGKVFVDVGASTGGFTQVLLLGGAKMVYCVDVGENLLDESLSSDKRVVVMDNTNARYLTPKDFPEKIDGVTVDCSFISLKTLLPAVGRLPTDEGVIVALIKPQFECGKNSLGKSGILLDTKRTIEVIKDIYDFSLAQGFCVKNLTFSPLNARKNTEYFILLAKKDENIPFKFIEDVVYSATEQKRGGKV